MNCKYTSFTFPNETLNFETNTGSTEIASNGTDFVGFGVTNDFYDGIDYEYALSRRMAFLIQSSETFQ